LAGKRIFAVNVLDKRAFASALAFKADTIISNEKACDTESYGDIQFVNSEVYRIPGTFEAYAYNLQVIDSLYKKYSHKLFINGIQIRNSLPKMVYWTNYKLGYLYACIKDKFKTENIVYISKYLSHDKLRETLKYIRHYISNNLQYFFKKSKHPEPVVIHKKIGLLVNDEFELGIFEYFIKSIEADDLIIFHYNNINFSKFGFISPEISKVDIGSILQYSPQSFMNPLKLSAEELSVVNIAARDWQQISSEIEQYKFIGASGIKLLVINVGENLPVKNLLPEIFKGKIKVYNTMNGMKSGEAHDADVYFYKWFVWDEQMKSMLVDKCKLNPDMLSPVGHMMRDFIQDYHFLNTIDIPLEKLKDKKVISIFSVRGNREEKLEAFKYLYDLLEKDNSYFLMIRPHPSEKNEDFIIPRNLHDNIRLITNNSKQTLYDQIHLSDMGIVFGSTVAIECQWMQVPAVTFEKREVSNIYCIDGHAIQHAHSMGELTDMIGKLEKKKTMDRTGKIESVAEKMTKVINDELTNKQYKEGSLKTN
jgi:hypothetical protein